MGIPLIRVQIGSEMRLIDYELFSDVHAGLAEHFRMAGLTGDALDVAIASTVEHCLEQILDSPSRH